MPCSAGVLDLLGAAHVPVAHRRHHLELGSQGGGGDVEADLVVALAGAAVGDRLGALVAGDVDEDLGDERPRQGGGQRVGSLVEGAGGEAGEAELLDEELARVDGIGGEGAGAQRPVGDRVDVLRLADVGRAGDRPRSRAAPAASGSRPRCPDRRSRRGRSAWTGSPGHLLDTASAPGRDRALHGLAQPGGEAVRACLERTTTMTVSSPATVPATSSKCAASITAATRGALPGRVRMTPMCSTNSMERTCSRMAVRSRAVTGAAVGLARRPRSAGRRSRGHGPDPVRGCPATPWPG